MDISPVRSSMMNDAYFEVFNKITHTSDIIITHQRTFSWSKKGGMRKVIKKKDSR